MQIVAVIIGLGILFGLLDGVVSKSNPSGCAKLAYLIIGALLVAGLALIALALFMYPLWHGKF